MNDEQKKIKNSSALRKLFHLEIRKYLRVSAIFKMLFSSYDMKIRFFLINTLYMDIVTVIQLWMGSDKGGY